MNALSPSVVEVVELNELDFEHAPECEHVTECSVSADWHGTTACPCKEDHYLCDAHRAREDSLIAQGRVHLPCEALLVVEWRPINP